jgi:hypothetical protein
MQMCEQSSPPIFGRGCCLPGAAAPRPEKKAVPEPAGSARARRPRSFGMSSWCPFFMSFFFLIKKPKNIFWEKNSGEKKTRKKNLLFIIYYYDGKLRRI